jgi:uncharacterized RDD family membrane protein YckC
MPYVRSPTGPRINPKGVGSRSNTSATDSRHSFAQACGRLRMSKTPDIDIASAAPPSLLRRLAAMFYDALLLIAILFIVAGLAVLLNRGEAIPSDNLAFPVSLLLVIGLFFLWFWTHGGQTLGMRAWRLCLVTDAGGTIGYRHALLRLLAALVSWLTLGVGHLWVLVDRDRLAWHDRLSRTRLIVLARPPS